MSELSTRRGTAGGATDHLPPGTSGAWPGKEAIVGIQAGPPRPAAAGLIIDKPSCITFQALRLGP